MTERLTHDMTRLQLAQALEDNYISMFRSFAALLDGDIEETAAGGRHYAFPNLPTFKSAWGTRLTADTVDAAIDETIAWFKARNAPYFNWWTHEGTTPDDLGNRLVARGFLSTEVDGGLDPAIPSTAQGSPVMVADMWALDYTVTAKAPSGFRITTVKTEADLAAFQDIALAIYPERPNVGESWVSATRYGGVDIVPWTLYIGWLDDEPVATNIIVAGGGIVSLWVVATHEAHRRKGIGAAITIDPLREWVAQGYRYAGLFASSMGEPVYARVGFTATGTRINRLSWRNDG